MPWEKRQRGDRYYVRARRDGERLIREYIGAGELAERVAQSDALAREERAALRWEASARVARIAAAEREVELFHHMVMGLVRLTLRAAGYEQHHRGEWRKRRASRGAADVATNRTDGTDGTDGTEVRDTMPRKDESARSARRPDHRAGEAWPAEEVQALVNLAQMGDPIAMAELRGVMDTDPRWSDQLSDFTQIARQHLAELAFGSNLVVREALERQVARLRRDLEPAAKSPLERVLVESALTSWAALGMAEMLSASSPNTEAAQRRVNHAHRRFIATVTAIAHVNRLLTPSVAQINIATAGAQQVNLGADPNGPVVGDGRGEMVVDAVSVVEVSDPISQ